MASVIFDLLKSMPKGTPIYTVVRHAAPSGKSRAVDAFVIPKEGQPRFLHPLAGDDGFGFALHPKHEGFLMQGLGFDTSRYLVRGIGRYVHHDESWFVEVSV